MSCLGDKWCSIQENYFTIKQSVAFIHVYINPKTPTIDTTECKMFRQWRNVFNLIHAKN